MVPQSGIIFPIERGHFNVFSNELVARRDYDWFILLLNSLRCPSKEKVIHPCSDLSQFLRGLLFEFGLLKFPKLIRRELSILPVLADLLLGQMLFLESGFSHF